MGEWKRLAGFALATIGIAVSLLLPWWEIESGGVTITISLRDIELCFAGSCEEADPGGYWGVLAIATFFWGLGCLFAVVMRGLIPAINGEPPGPSAVGSCVVYLGLAGITAWSLPDFVIVPPKTIWFWAGILGPIGALAGSFSAAVGRRAIGDGAPTLYRPPVIEAPRRAAFPALRFAVAEAELREDALVATLPGGVRRELPWSELGGAIARELRDEPPFEATLMVDLVPRGGSPLRIVAETTLTFAAGAPASDDARDRLRRVLAFARAMNPAIEVESATAEFVVRRDALPTWSLAELARYEARYR